jgi:hypothetical protein
LKRIFFLLLVSILMLQLTSKAQENQFSDLSFNSTVISVTRTKFLDNKKLATSDSIRKKMTEEMKLDLAQKIISKVDVKSTSNTSQTNETSRVGGNKRTENNVTQKSDYYFMSTISSSAILQNPDVKFNYEEATRTLRGRMSINIADFTQQNYSLLKNKSEDLVRKVDIMNETSFSSSRVDQNTYNMIHQGNLELKSLKELIVVYNGSLIKNDSVLLENLEKIDRAEFNLLTKIESEEFQEKLRSIQVLKANRQFYSALQQIKLLIIDYPNNQSLIAIKSEILNDIENSSLSKLTSSDFLLSLKTMEELELLDNAFIEKFSGQKPLLERKAFDQYLKRAENEFEGGQYKTAANTLQEIARLKRIDNKTYDDLQKEIDNKLFELELKDVDSRISHKEYVDAYYSLKQAQKLADDESEVKQVTNREDGIIDGITTQKIEKTKKTRDYSLQAQLGITGLTFLQNTTSVTLDENMLRQATPMVNFGIFKRVVRGDGFKNSNSHDWGSNLVGLRMSMWIPGTILKSNTPLTGTPKVRQPIFEPQLSIFMMRLIEFNIGKLFGNLSDSLGIKDPGDYYSLSIGIKPRISHMNFNTGFKLISDLNNNNHLSFYIGMNLGVNFKRKFRKSETKGIRADVKRTLLSSYDRVK